MSCASSAPAACIHDLFSASTLRRQAGQHLQRRQESGFLLDDAVNGEIADGEFQAHGNLLLWA